MAGKKIHVPEPVPLTRRFITESEARALRDVQCDDCDEWLKPDQRDAHQCQGRPLQPRARREVQEMIDASIAQAFARLLAAITGEG
ncbi:MAG: hypothetical protein IT372_05200 [Polyangiaceae bacterium]|nr:hypothetical protein [Polyangiaceae bacterium]